MNVKISLPGSSMILLLMFLSNLVSMPLRASDDKTLSPYFLVNSSDPSVDRLPLRSTKAEVNIAGVIADVTVTQVYKNEGQNTLEAIYVFPASTKAAVYGMKMKVGSRTIVAEIKEKEVARREYEAAKSTGKRASLLEQSRPNVFQMNVANIAPGDEIKVTLQYTELLVPTKGVYEFAYPTVVGPRYSEQPAATASASEQFVATPYTKAGKLPTYDFDIKVHLAAGMPIQDVTCNTHQVNIHFKELTTAEIYLDKSESSGGNRDYILNYQLAGGEIESGLLLYEHGDENFFLLMVQPPKRVTPKKLPPREYVFIVDVSGSMRGFPLNTSKKLLRDLIVNLKPTDKFNVLLFAGTSGALADESLLASTENINMALNVIDNQRGGGGTRLLPAMQKALDLPRAEGISRSMVIVTDGYVRVEKEAFDLIRNNLDQSNLFSFGIGSSVNRYIIEGMAHVGMGEPMIITKPSEAHEQAEDFRQYIKSPVLTQIKPKFSDFEVYDMEPVSVPDVLADRPIIIFGKYRGKPKGKITIKGFTGNNKRYKKTFDVSQYKASPKNAALRYLWAREKVKVLDDYNKLERYDARKAEITQLGLDYNLMTAYTSFVAVDHEIVRNSSGKLVKVKQPLPLPKGVPNTAVGFDLSIGGMVRRALSPLDKVEKVEPVSIRAGVVTGKMSAEDHCKLQEQVNAQAAMLKICFKSSGSKKGLKNIRLAISIDREGNVVAIKTLCHDLPPQYLACLKRLIANWKFDTGQAVTFELPLTLAR